MKLKLFPSRPWKVVLSCALLVGLVLIIYLPATGGGFIWDDDVYVTNNSLLTLPDGLQRIWFSAERQSQFFPLTFTTLRWERAFWGLNPLGYHLVNVLLHAINALLVWLVLKKLAVPGAGIAAALFAFHPVQVESVAWVTELKNIQATFFYLLAVLMWLRFIRPEPVTRWRYYWLALFFYMLSLFSKTVSCTLPAALLLVTWMQENQIGWRKIFQMVPFVVIGLAAGLVSIWWESYLGNYHEDVGQTLTWVERTLVAAHALWFYAGKLVWPMNLTFSYPHWQVRVNDPINYLYLAGCMAVTFALWHWRKIAGRRVIGAVIFFAATLSPLLGFIPLYTFRYSYVADHYQYVASIGLMALAAVGLSRMPRVFSIIVLSILGFQTWEQAHIYRNQTVLWQDTLSKNPASWMAHNNLGMVLKDEGEFDQAIDHYRSAIQLKPDFAQGHYNLGIVLFKKGQSDEAVAEFQKAITFEPHDVRAYYNYAIALDEQGFTDAAVKQYEAALRVDPDYVDARINLGITFGRQGKIDEALAQFQEAVRLSPDSAESHNNLGAVLRAKGQLDEAVEQFKKAILLNPNYAIAHSNLGIILLKQGRTDDAINQLQEALRLNPDDSDARASVDAAFATKGLTDKVSPSVSH